MSEVPAESAGSGRVPANRPSTGGGRSGLVTERGRTTIADTVVQKIAGIAAREVSGVYDLGTGGSRAMGAVRQRLPGSTGPSVTQGVSVEVGESQAAVDVDIVCMYGVSIADLAVGVRRNITQAIEGMTGLEVVEVNITVDDIHVPTAEGEGTGAASGASRVQ